MVRRSWLALLCALASCASPTPPAAAPEPPTAAALRKPPEERARKEADLAAAQAAVDADPTSEEKLIWLGRRLAYLDRFDEAQAVYTRALEIHPASWKLLRHRGHRWITLRQFDRALQDLARAWELCKDLPDEIEPDGQPNAAGVPIGSYHSNIVYHWALAHYLRGEWSAAAEVWRVGRESSSRNDDRLCSSSYWNYLALRRGGAEEEARQVIDRVREPLHVVENESYRQLCRLFRGENGPEDVMQGIEPGTVEFATRGYGVACWQELRGWETAAREMRERVLAAGPRNAFGVIAAEADSKR